MNQPYGGRFSGSREKQQEQVGSAKSPAQVGSVTNAHQKLQQAKPKGSRTAENKSGLFSSDNLSKQCK